MHGVYEYKNTTAVIWACDETDSKVFELRVFMLETVPAARLERVSRFIENANQQVTLGGFKLGERVVVRWLLVAMKWAEFAWV